MKKALISISLIGVIIVITISIFNSKKEAQKRTLPILGEYELSFFTKDTIHYKVSGVELTNDNGLKNDDVLADNANIKIVNFFFSSCPSICPMMNQNLNSISHKMNDYNVVINSISIDPKTDTPQKLSEYRTQNEYKNSNWIFYTGEKSEIFKMAQNCKLKAFEDESQNNTLVHDPTVVLLDKKNQIRGYYNSLKKEDIMKLEKDIFELLREHS